MPSSKLLKERIESIQDTRKITNAMYLISSSKLRKARKNYQNVLPYFTRMRDTISRVVPHLPDEPVHPFFHERQREDGELRRAYLVLTADKGMAGSFNQNVLKLLLEKAERNDRFYVIGQVGYRALRKDPRLVQEFQYGATAPSLQRARDITVDAIDDFKSGKLDEIYLVYTRIENALTSEPTMVRLLPLDREHLQPAPKGLGDPRGEVEMFPDAWTVFEQTAPIYMHGMIFGAMTESFCAVHTDHADDVQDQVLAGDVGAELALEHELDGRGHLEPCHAGGHTGGHIGGANAGGECAQCAVGAGVAVGADDAVTGCHNAFFGQQSVLDAHLAHIVEVEDVVLVGELAALLGLGRALDVLVGNEVVEDDGDVLFVEHAVETRLFELVDGDGGSDVIAQHDVELGVDELACLDLGKTGMCGKNFLRQGHSHDGTLLLSKKCFYLLLIALTSALMPATMISVSVPAPHVTVLSPQTRPT